MDTENKSLRTYLELIESNNKSIICNFMGRNPSKNSIEYIKTQHNPHAHLITHFYKEKLASVSLFVSDMEKFVLQNFVLSNNKEYIDELQFFFDLVSKNLLVDNIYGPLSSYKAELQVDKEVLQQIYVNVFDLIKFRKELKTKTGYSELYEGSILDDNIDEVTKNNTRKDKKI